MTSMGAQASLDKAIADYDTANEKFYALLYLLTESPAYLLVVRHEDSTGASGYGLQSLQQLVNK